MEEITNREWQMIKCGLAKMTEGHKNNAIKAMEQGCSDGMYLHAAEKYNTLLEKLEKLHPYKFNETNFKQEFTSKWVGSED